MHEFVFVVCIWWPRIEPCNQSSCVSADLITVYVICNPGPGPVIFLNFEDQGWAHPYLFGQHLCARLVVRPIQTDWSGAALKSNPGEAVAAGYGHLHWISNAARGGLLYQTSVLAICISVPLRRRKIARCCSQAPRTSPPPATSTRCLGRRSEHHRKRQKSTPRGNGFAGVAAPDAKESPAAWRQGGGGAGRQGVPGG
jgi:hypothetical protein